MYSKLQDGSFIVCGYVARNSELKTVGEKNSSLCRWSVKVREKTNGEKKDTIWVNCQAWHDIARLAKNIKKGDTVLCVGKLETNQGNDGKVYKNLVCEFISIMKPVPKTEDESTSKNSNDLVGFSEFEEILSNEEPPF